MQRRLLKDGKRTLYWKDVQGNVSRHKKKTRNSWILLRLEVQGSLSHQDTKDIQETQKLLEIQGKFWPHHYQKSPDCVPHMNKVFSIVRQTYGPSPTDDLNDLDVNTAF